MQKYIDEYRKLLTEDLMDEFAGLQQKYFIQERI